MLLVPLGYRTADSDHTAFDVKDRPAPSQELYPCFQSYQRAGLLAPPGGLQHFHFGI